MASKFFKAFNFFKGKGKVSPTIKSVEPSVTVRKKGVKASLEKTRSDEYRKRYTALDKSEAKVKTGKKMMQEGQRERKRGGKMRKKGAKGAPTAANFARAKQTARKR